jgi:hypothetical protein
LLTAIELRLSFIESDVGFFASFFLQSQDNLVKMSKPEGFSLEDIIRPNILKLQPYRCARDDYSAGKSDPRFRYSSSAAF